MPTELDGISVVVNGKPAYVYYISPTQVNILTPPDLVEGQAQLQLTNNGTASSPIGVPVQTLSPPFFVFGGGPYVAATHADGSLLGPVDLFPGSSTPARLGETIVLYANGFGLTDVPVSPGSVAQSGKLSPLPLVTIGGTSVSVSFAGLVAPGQYQFNVQVPASLSDGDQPITVTYKGLATQTGVVITIKR